MNKIKVFVINDSPTESAAIASALSGAGNFDVTTVDLKAMPNDIRQRCCDAAEAHGPDLILIDRSFDQQHLREAGVKPSTPFETYGMLRDLRNRQTLDLCPLVFGSKFWGAAELSEEGPRRAKSGTFLLRVEWSSGDNFLVAVITQALFMFPIYMFTKKNLGLAADVSYLGSNLPFIYPFTSPAGGGGAYKPLDSRIGLRWIKGAILDPQWQKLAEILEETNAYRVQSYGTAMDLANVSDDLLPDIVFLRHIGPIVAWEDCEMNGQDGEETAKMLRSDDRFDRVPIILMVDAPEWTKALQDELEQVGIFIIHAYRGPMTSLANEYYARLQALACNALHKWPAFVFAMQNGMGVPPFVGAPLLFGWPLR